MMCQMYIYIYTCIHIYKEREREGGGLEYYTADKPETDTEDTIESNHRDDDRN